MLVMLMSSVPVIQSYICSCSESAAGTSTQVISTSHRFHQNCKVIKSDKRWLSSFLVSGPTPQLFIAHYSYVRSCVFFFLQSVNGTAPAAELKLRPTQHAQGTSIASHSMQPLAQELAQWQPQQVRRYWREIKWLPSTL